MNPDRIGDLARPGPSRRLKADENDIFNEAQEVRNERALAVYNRVQHKLTGERDVCALLACKSHPQV